jgi:hypothetical protein
MIRFGAMVLVATLGLTTGAHAQHSIQVEGPDRERATVIVRRALGGAHDVMLADSTRRLVLPRGTDIPRTVLILGGDASIGATVRGDVIVVGGDAFLRPGAAIDGRVVAIGGGVYGSTLASVKGGTESLRDHTFDVTQSGSGTTLVYRYIGGREPRFELPLLEGLRIPTYDRVAGASIAWGPVLRPTTRWVVDPIVTYRSHLGDWDPGLNAQFELGEQYTLSVDARRGMYTNDAWIYSGIINSVTALATGRDVRNYYRADRGELEIRRRDQYVRSPLELERFVAVASERAWSVGSTDTLGGRPWSAFGRDASDKIRRPNPRVTHGRISSAVIGAVARYQLTDVRMNATTTLEVPFESPGDERFGQLTFDGTVQFPTFGVQRFRFDLHAVVTVGDTAPPQRFAYLGGSGTLPLVEEPLSLGGDQLLHLDSRYEIPIQRIKLPLIGSPTFSIRHRIGSAGVQRLPRFIQNVGPSLTLSFVRLEYLIDPATGDDRFKVGVSFAR